MGDSGKEALWFRRWLGVPPPTLLQITYQMDFSEYRSIFRRVMWKRTVLVGVGLCVVALSMIVVTLTAKGSGDNQGIDLGTSFGHSMVVYVLIFAGYLLLRTFLVRRVARKRFELGAGSHPVECSFTGDGAAASWPGTTFSVDWNSFQRMEEWKEHFLLLLRSGAYLAIPKRSMDSDQTARFRSLMAYVFDADGKRRKADPAIS